jgi:hypothetical protein
MLIRGQKLTSRYNNYSKNILKNELRPVDPSMKGRSHAESSLRIRRGREMASCSMFGTGEFHTSAITCPHIFKGFGTRELKRLSELEAADYENKATKRPRVRGIECQPGADAVTPAVSRCTQRRHAGTCQRGHDGYRLHG